MGLTLGIACIAGLCLWVYKSGCDDEKRGLRYRIKYLEEAVRAAEALIDNYEEAEYEEVEVVSRLLSTTLEWGSGEGLSMEEWDVLRDLLRRHGDE